MTKKIVNADDIRVNDCPNKKYHKKNNVFVLIKEIDIFSQKKDVSSRY